MRFWFYCIVVAALGLVAVRVLAVVDCCYGTQCAAPDPSQCTLRKQWLANECKRTCLPDCTQGNGCCQWTRMSCVYEKKTPTSICPGPSEENSAVNWWSNRFCRNQGQGDQVPCLETGNQWCLTQ